MRLHAPMALVALVAAATALLPATQAQAAGSVVKVTGGQGAWQLTVNGSPYTIKGVTWGPSPSDAAADMPDLTSMGVNTVRTWGTDATSQPLFDAAAANGIKVIAGFWLQPGGGPGAGGCVDYVNDAAYKSSQLSAITQWVTAYKDNAGVLMWDVGNESVLGMQNCYSGAQLEQERDAYVSFVDQAAQAIHGIDPNHPVTSTDAWTGAWPYFKAYAPHLDLYAVNSYQGVCGIKSDWHNGGYTVPYIVTESGPPGEWEVPNDANGVPLEPNEQQSADGYTNAWNCVESDPGVSLGATMFNYGTEYDFGGLWFNLIPAGERQLSYYAVKKAYGGDTSHDNTPPVVSSVTVPNPSSVVAGQPLTLTAQAADPNGDAISYEVLYSSKYVDGDGGLTSQSSTDLGGGRLQVTAPSKPGVWKIFVKAHDGHGNVGVGSLSVRVVPPPVSGTNVALGRPTTASSFESDGYGGCPCGPADATDGDLTTRWASDWSDPQWLQVDLGTVTALHHIQLDWESAYGKDYTIQVSNDGQTWQTIHTTTGGDGGIDDFDVSGSGRYVRLDATARGTGYGYSLYEFGVYS
ncbi:discoidin domain-containing protein [Streptomyces sp. SL13]|jgi:exo-beta-1,3-glucanase (GH17 family)|uniref:beta-mannosidase n=1 Tax=Streptantibioticus silvisoli TaxID=2705255 RepID=A0AA90KEC1_9ACTN|nr:discoidin domain-containing protein [Streptantibioticus silvisoli]MDI5967860.1 discoidin domain-containing protein [Streptantibioticus silvisoli]